MSKIGVLSDDSVLQTIILLHKTRLQNLAAKYLQLTQESFTNFIKN